MPGKRVNIDDETWTVLDLLGRDRMATFQELADEAFADLNEALRLHSEGRVSADPTIGTCWDADRLHLPRVSIVPDPAFLSTRAARAPERLSDAEALRRDGPPAWDELVALV